ncbi:MAG: hypothetical protein NTV93_07740 [Verrucomicrobia bacterium]|nr:hypothetical protein [Verrucomicrobiota bacterium]
MTANEDQNGEWLRLPKEGERCSVTGLSRASLNQILTETDPETGEKLVESFTKSQPGTSRGIKLINSRSLLDYMESAAKAQNGLRFAKHILNPDRDSLDVVLGDKKTFNEYLNPDADISDYEWERGGLRTRHLRILALLEKGVLERIAPPEAE